MSVGISSDTVVFAIESIRKWWYAQGAECYGGVDEIVGTADCGGGNGYRNRFWKYELHKLVNEIKKNILVLHYPLGTSKWNKIEHGLFAFISKKWQGKPLTSKVLVISLIGAATTVPGLAVICGIDESKYETGIRSTDEEFDILNSIKSDFHGEWNYAVTVYS
ncbi:putative ISAzo13 family transposase ISDssp3 [Hollandina sp. SP2]